MEKINIIYSFRISQVF